MAETRQKSIHILLTTGGKSDLVEGYESLQWDKGEGDVGLYRVKVNGKWYCPLGKYTFLSKPKIGELCRALLADEDVNSEPAVCPYLPIGAEVRVDCGPIECGVPTERRRGIVMATPQLSPIDGRWYVEVRISRIGWRFVLADNVKPWRQ